MPYIIKRNNVTLDAFIEPSCVKWNERSGMHLMCSIEDNPEGISCARTGQIYHVDGWAEPHGETDTVTLIEVSQSVYEETKNQLDRGEVTPAMLQVEVERNRADVDFALALLGADEQEVYDE